jgi:tRNA (guanine10-N2)-methyltransferase
VSRSVRRYAHGLFEVYGEGATYEELVAQLDMDVVNRQVFQVPGQSLRVDCSAWGASLPQEEKLRRIFQVLSHFPGKVKVDLKRPTLPLFLMEQRWSPNNTDNHLHRVFLAREICSRSHSLPDEYSLSKRVLLSTTAMDASLALIMANMGLVREHTLVCDPFVGSGSVSVVCAHFGGYCVGMDYDGRCFRGDDPGQTIRACFSQYGSDKRYVGVLRADFSQRWMNRRPLFDAIVTDPPYGIREGIKRVGLRPNYIPGLKEIPAEANLQERVPMRQAYPYDELLADILAFAADTLVPGGRLVFWHASPKELPLEEFDEDEALPKHPLMKLHNIGLQICGTVNRRLIMYEKVAS